MMRASGEAYRNIRLCVDDYESGVLSGQAYFPALDQKSRPFRSFVEFLLETEDAMDRESFPQSYTAKRFFSTGYAREDSRLNVEKTEKGKRGTFDIRMVFRQHASWQGTVTWIEGRGEQSFRSVLELIRLIDSALGDRRETAVHDTE